MGLGPQPHEEATPLALPGTSGEVSGSHPGSYRGITVRETTGSATAKVVLYDNASAASGPILEEVSLSAGASFDQNYPPPGDRFVGNGLYAQVTGAIEGSVFQ